MHLQCRHIHFKYTGTGRVLFDDLNLAFDEPGLHALFGPSGIGKSSLAHIISGRQAIDAGEVIFNGSHRPLYTYNLERLPGWSSVGRHLERVTPDHHKTQMNQLVHVFGLAALLNQRFSQLSLGQQNRVNLVRYLVQDFSVLIMDESLANVDERMRGRILGTIKEMFPKMMFLYISHNAVEVAAYCRRIWVLRAIHKAPQAVMVKGQDRSSENDIDPAALQKVLLEIMNAA